MNDTYKKFVHNMRLDLYLVREKLVASRSRAQRSIKSGLVAVDGRTILKPSFDVTHGNSIIVAASVDKPAGYWKLKGIQEAVGLIKICLLYTSDAADEEESVDIGGRSII